MGLVALFKFLLPLLLDGLKEITVPKRPDEHSRTSVGIRVCILVIVLLLFLLGFVTDKLYEVHTQKVNMGAQVTVLTNNMDNCNATLTKLNESLVNSCKAINPPRKPPVHTNVTVKPPIKVSKSDEERMKMVYEINEY